MTVARGSADEKEPVVMEATNTPETQEATSTAETKVETKAIVPTYKPKIKPQPATNTEESSAPKEYLYLKGGIYASKLDRVISCESGWNVNARNSTSTASGLAQFLASTWISTRLRMGLDTSLSLRFDYKEMIDTTIFLWDEGRGASHWNASRFCWG